MAKFPDTALAVRVLRLFVDSGVFAALSGLQRRLFSTVDVLLTGALLGGGADGLHKLVRVFTTLLDSTAELAKGRGKCVRPVAPSEILHARAGM